MEVIKLPVETQMFQSPLNRGRYCDTGQEPVPGQTCMFQSPLNRGRYCDLKHPTSSFPCAIRFNPLSIGAVIVTQGQTLNWAGDHFVSIPSQSGPLL